MSPRFLWGCQPGFSTNEVRHQGNMANTYWPARLRDLVTILLKILFLVKHPSTPTTFGLTPKANFVDWFATTIPSNTYIFTSALDQNMLTQSLPLAHKDSEPLILQSSLVVYPPPPAKPIPLYINSRSTKSSLCSTVQVRKLPLEETHSNFRKSSSTPFYLSQHLKLTTTKTSKLR